MNKSQLRLTIIALLLLTVILGGCSLSTSNTNNNTGAENDAKPSIDTETAASTPLYFIVGNYLAGSWQDNSWHSMNPADGESYENNTTYYIKDLLTQKEYNLYNQEGKLAAANSIQFCIGEGLGGFESTAAESLLGPYSNGKESNDYYSSFILPQVLGNECQEIAVPNYAFSFSFDNPDTILATNSVSELLPRNVVRGEGLNDFAKAELMGMLAENGLENAPNFTDSLTGDIDNDGKDEYIMIANTPLGESGYPYISEFELTHNSGSFSVALYEDDDGSFQTLFSMFDPYQKVPEKAGELLDIDHCYRNELLGAFDLNGDDTYEICLNQVMWEGGYILVLAQDADGNYQTVMRANYGM